MRFIETRYDLNIVDVIILLLFGHAMWLVDRDYRARLTIMRKIGQVERVQKDRARHERQ
jgi:hypothetical protein